MTAPPARKQRMNPMMATPVLMPPPSTGVRKSAEWLLWSLSLAMMAPLLLFRDDDDAAKRAASSALGRESERRARASCLFREDGSSCELLQARGGRSTVLRIPGREHEVLAPGAGRSSRAQAASMTRVAITAASEDALCASIGSGARPG